MLCKKAAGSNGRIPVPSLLLFIHDGINLAVISKG